LWNFSI
jgi:large subunit ribosomal protein L4